MRHNNSKRPQRGSRPQNKKSGQGGNNKMKVFDSNGPDARIRGTAYQITEKYEALAKDAETSGNVVLAENYRQHGEHYQRLINEFEENDNRLAKIREDNERKAQANNKSESADEDELGLPASMIAEAKVKDELVSA